MLRTVNCWQGPQVIQILCYYIIGHTYRLQAMCFLFMHTTVNNAWVKIVKILELDQDSGTMQVLGIDAGYR